MRKLHHRRTRLRLDRILVLGVALLLAADATARSQPQPATSNDYLFNDTHFHLTNYIQEGVEIHDFLKTMGNKAGRVSLFGIPLQQQWSYRVDADRAPTYYLNTDAPLYYYSFGCRFSSAFISPA